MKVTVISTDLSFKKKAQPKKERKRFQSKVTIISTVYNEGDSAKDLMDSLANQTLKPDEVIVIDGGSTDNTLQILESYKNKVNNLKIHVEPNANIARGRNLAISKATNEFVATIDGGCRADKDWLENLVKTQDRSGADVVAGAYKADPRNLFERVQGFLVVPEFSKLPDDWPPSSRSQLLRKSFWEKAGKYPENLYTAEDTIFNYNLKSAGAKYFLAKNAFVNWRMRPTFGKLWKQFFNYGKGDGMIRLPFKSKSNINVARSLSVLGGIWAFIVMLLLSVYFQSLWAIGILALLFLLYIFSGSLRIYSKFHSCKAVFYGAAIGFIRRIAYFLGFHRGLLQGGPKEGVRFA